MRISERQLFPWHHRGLLLLLMSLTWLTGGCTLVRSLMVQTAPTTEKVTAEYADLADKHVVIYVWAPPEVLWDYPQIRLDLASFLSAYLKANIDNIQIIDPRQMEEYVKSNSARSIDAVEAGRHFDADRVIDLSVYKFSLRDPGMSQFYRGRLSASVIVYEMNGADESAKRIPLQDETVVVPEEGPLGLYNVTAEQVRDSTYRVFTDTVGRKFHDWERQLD